MLKFSKKTDYGLALLSQMATDSRPASARELAARHHLPPPMVANILKSLGAGGILESTRGAQGGYRLARPARAVSLAEIVEALDGPFNLVDCVADGDSCRFTEVCPTYDPIQVVHEKFQTFMRDLSLAEIIGFPARPFELGKFDHEKTTLPR